MFLGVILLIAGAVVVSGYSVYLDFITGRYMESAVFILVMGIVVIAVSAIGKYQAMLPVNRSACWLIIQRYYSTVLQPDMRIVASTLAEPPRIFTL